MARRVVEKERASASNSPFRVLAESIRAELLEQDSVPGSLYFSDRELVTRSGLSLMTVRKAVAEVLRDGLLERRPGSGTYVTQRVVPLRAQRRRVAESVLFSGWDPAALTTWEAMYFRDVYAGIRLEIQDRQLRFLSDASTADASRNEALPKNLRGAVLLVGSRSVERAEELKAAGVRLITINFHVPQVTSIEPDIVEGERIATGHLLLQGHRHLAHLNSGESTPHWVGVRKGFEAAVREIGSCPVLLSTLQRGSVDAGYELAQQALSLTPRPTALVCGNDLMAIGALRCLHERGIRVPQQMSVIGFDNIEATEICTPRLSTVAVDREALGRQAVRWLLNGATTECARLKVDATFKPRESSGPAPA